MLDKKNMASCLKWLKIDSVFMIIFMFNQHSCLYLAIKDYCVSDFTQSHVRQKDLLLSIASTY